MMENIPTARAASEEFGVDFSTVCHWCRGECKSKGFWWRYHVNLVTFCEEEKLVGKWLRVEDVSDSGWYEGHNAGFDQKTGEHTIIDDSGNIKKAKLSSITYKWKNDLVTETCGED
jgi:hypothetical protein